MTNEQKSDLRWWIRTKPHRSDEYIADMVECAVSTVKRYRKALTK